jgi:hypothetical protein
VQPSRRLHFCQLVLDANDHAPIGFDLRFAGTAEKAKAAALPFEMGPGSHQAAALIVEVREFDLQRTFARLGASSKDFQDQAGAIEHLRVPCLLEVALLHRRQRAVHHHEFCRMRADEADDFFDLALADIGRRPDLADGRDDRVLHIEIDRTGEPGRLFEARGNAARQNGVCRTPIARSLFQVRANDDDPSCGVTPGRPRTVDACFFFSTGFQSVLSQAGASSLPSNNWIGAPGMMVEIACL